MKSSTLLRLASALAAALFLWLPSASAQPAPTNADRQAAYCMEASSGFAQRLTQFIAQRRAYRDSAQALLAKPDTTEANKKNLSAQVAELNAEIAKSEAERDHWVGDTRLFMNYLKRRGFMEGARDLTLLATMTAEVRKDQQAVSAMYLSCVKQCSESDTSCRSACDKKSNASDPNSRMLQCQDRAGEFK